LLNVHPNANGNHIPYGLSFFKYYAIGFSVFDTSFFAFSEHLSSSSPKNTTNRHRHTPQVPQESRSNHSHLRVRKVSKWRPQLCHFETIPNFENPIATNHLLTHISNNPTLTTSGFATYVISNPETKGAVVPKIRPWLHQVPANTVLGMTRIVRLGINRSVLRGYG
jgi:hypothetical protein